MTLSERESERMRKMDNLTVRPTEWMDAPLRWYKEDEIPPTRKSDYRIAGLTLLAIALGWLGYLLWRKP